MKTEEKIDIILLEFNKFKFKAIFDDIIRNIKKLTHKKAEELFLKHWKQFKEYLKKQKIEKDALRIINKNLNTNFSSIDAVPLSSISIMKNEETINEDLKHFWIWVKDHAFPTLSFYPALTVWLQLDKLLTGSGDFSLRLTILYSVFWLLLISGKFVGEWKKWKKENPEEFEKEGKKKHAFSI